MSSAETERTDPEGSNSAILQVTITNESSSINNRIIDLKKSADFLHQFDLNCPFTWKPDSHLKFNLEDIQDDYSDTDELFDQSGFRIRRFVVNLLHCYLNFFKRLITKSLENLEEMESMLSSNSKRQDVYFTTINEALFHIMLSCKVYLLHESNRNDEAMNVIKKIKPVEQMDEVNQAGIWGIRANVYAELGYNGLHGAVLYLDKAISIDKKNAYWYFLKGVYKGRIRRIESGLAIPSIDEIKSLEIAMKLKQDAAFYAFAAEAYSETATRSSKSLKEKFYGGDENSMAKIKNYIDNMNAKAREYFCECISLNPVCSHLLFRCGKGLLKLQPPYQDYKRGFEYLKRGLNICPTSNYGNHAMAKYYERVEKNNELAKKYLKVSVEKKNFGASLDLLRIEFFQTKDADALLKGFIKLFDLYQDKVRHCKILAEIISFRLFIDYNISECINYMNKLLYLINDNHQLIKKYFSGILPLKRPISLLDVLLGDILYRSKENSLSAEEKEVCETFLKKLCYDNVELPKVSRENVREQITKEIERNLDDINLDDIKRAQATTSQNYNPVQCKRQEFMKNYEEDLSRQENVMKYHKFGKKDYKLDVKLELKMGGNNSASSSKDNDIYNLAERFSKIYASRNKNGDLRDDRLSLEEKLGTENREVGTSLESPERCKNDYNDNNRSEGSKIAEKLRSGKESCVKKSESENDEDDRRNRRRRSSSRETCKSKKEKSRYEDNEKYDDDYDRRRRRRSESRETQRYIGRRKPSNDRYERSSDDYDRRHRQRSNSRRLRTSSNSSYELSDDDYDRRHHRRRSTSRETYKSKKESDNRYELSDDTYDSYNHRRRRRSESRETYKSRRETSNNRFDDDYDRRHRRRRSREKSSDRNYRRHHDIKKRSDIRESCKSRNKGERFDDPYSRRSYKQRSSTDEEDRKKDRYYYSEDEDRNYHRKERNTSKSHESDDEQYRRKDDEQREK